MSTAKGSSHADLSIIFSVFIICIDLLITCDVTFINVVIGIIPIYYFQHHHYYHYCYYCYQFAVLTQIVIKNTPLYSNTGHRQHSESEMVIQMFICHKQTGYRTVGTDSLYIEPH